ncbi:MAG: zf-HC2 domain-containing protein [Pseudonocardiaceae bacterium]
MDCAQRKEALSAWLDGEESDTERDAIDAHLTICAACRRFADKAAHVTRLARTVVAAHEPDVIEVVLPAARPSRRAQRDGTPDAPGTESRLILRMESGLGWRDDQPQDSDVRAAVAAAQWCGCTCCRRLARWFRPSP